jgi:hypothetical protein
LGLSQIPEAGSQRPAIRNPKDRAIAPLPSGKLKRRWPPSMAIASGPGHLILA